MKIPVQIFLSAEGSANPLISEVSIDDETGEPHCTCPGFTARGTCKHTVVIKARVEENNGVYQTKLSDEADLAESTFTFDSEESVHKFLLKYGKIEIL